MNEDRREGFNTWLRGGGIIFAAFAFTLFIYFLCQRLLDSARHRLTYFTAEGEVTRSQSNARRETPAYSPVAPNPVPRVTAGYGPGSAPLLRHSAQATIPSPMLTAPSRETVDRLLGTADFGSEQERQFARASLADVRTTIRSVEQYDSRSLWEELPDAGLSDSSSLRAFQEGTDTGTDPDPSGSRLYPAPADSSASRRQEIINRIYNETEALATELTLVCHPDRFPAQVRDQVQLVGREARIYLSTVQLSLGHPEDRSNLKGLARQHLTRCQNALRQLEQAVGEGGGVAGSAMN